MAIVRKGKEHTADPVQLDGVDPEAPVLGVLGPQVPHAVVDADVQPALVKLVGLPKSKENIAVMFAWLVRWPSAAKEHMNRNERKS